MPRLDLRLQPETDPALTPWCALRVMQQLINGLHEALGMPLVTEEAVRVMVGEMLRETRQTRTAPQPGETS